MYDVWVQVPSTAPNEKSSIHWTFLFSPVFFPHHSSISKLSFSLFKAFSHKKLTRRLPCFKEVPPCPSPANTADRMCGDCFLLSSHLILLFVAQFIVHSLIAILAPDAVNPAEPLYTECLVTRENPIYASSSLPFGMLVQIMHASYPFGPEE